MAITFFNIKKRIELNKINFLQILILSIFFTLQQFSEDRFYSQINKYFDLNIYVNNFYLINIFLSFYITILLISIIFHNHKSILINYFPYMFLIVGAFNGFNLNFYNFSFICRTNCFF